MTAAPPPAVEVVTLERAAVENILSKMTHFAHQWFTCAAFWRSQSSISGLCKVLAWAKFMPE
jgi:hypothetical protein